MYHHNTNVAQITLATHFFTIKPFTQHVYNLVYKFAFGLSEYEFKWDPHLRKNTRTLSRVWGGRLKNNTEFRYPISLYEKFIKLLERNGVNLKLVEFIKLPLYEPAKVNFVLNKNYQPRDYQLEAADFTNKQKAEGFHSVMLDMPTGTGKTVTLMNYAANLGLRMGIVVAPAHFDSWIKYCGQYLNLPKERVYEVRGGKAIRKLFALAETDDFDYDVVLFSLRTLTEFFDKYETNPEETLELYGGSPFGLWSYTKIGFLGGDEVHESFFNVYRLQTFLHGPFHLGLSATMLHKDPFIEARQIEIYPRSRRFDKIPLPKHVRLINVAYYFENMHRDKIVTTFPRKVTYSQAAYENSILKNKKVKKNFLNMLTQYVEEFYIQRCIEGERCVLYFFRIDMLNEVVSHLSKLYPNKVIKRYAENDPLENILESDICATTVGSAGTGIDVDKMSTLINFVMMETAQKNIQLQGRLREKKSANESDKFFIQLYAPEIKKHIEYKNYRDNLLSQRISGRVERSYQNSL